MSTSHKNISDQEEHLFEEWERKRGYTKFVKDGTVDGEAYLQSNRKVAFILKEYPNKGIHDLRDHELQNPYGGGWWKVAKILNGINNIERNRAANNDGAPDKMPDNICAFNLKKEGGAQVTDWDELKEVAERDRDYIREQFEIYDPDLTFCMGYDTQAGNMLDIFRKVMGHDLISKKHTKKDGWSWYERSPGKIVINTYHMSYPRLGVKQVLAQVKEIDAKRKSK